MNIILFIFIIILVGAFISLIFNYGIVGSYKNWKKNREPKVIIERELHYSCDLCGGEKVKKEVEVCESDAEFLKATPQEIIGLQMTCTVHGEDIVPPFKMCFKCWQETYRWVYEQRTNKKGITK